MKARLTLGGWESFQESIIMKRFILAFEIATLGILGTWTFAGQGLAAPLTQVKKTVPPKQSLSEKIKSLAQDENNAGFKIILHPKFSAQELNLIKSSPLLKVTKSGETKTILTLKNGKKIALRREGLFNQNATTQLTFEVLQRALKQFGATDILSSKKTLRPEFIASLKEDLIDRMTPPKVQFNDATIKILDQLDDGTLQFSSQLLEMMNGFKDYNVGHSVVSFVDISVMMEKFDAIVDQAMNHGGGDGVAEGWASSASGMGFSYPCEGGGGNCAQGWYGAKPDSNGGGGFVQFIELLGFTSNKKNGENSGAQYRTIVNDKGEETGVLKTSDNDTDNDGIDNNRDSDVDGDGKPNDQDSDMDGDGVPNDQDPNPKDSTPENGECTGDCSSSDEDDDGIIFGKEHFTSLNVILEQMKNEIMGRYGDTNGEGDEAPGGDGGSDGNDDGDAFMNLIFNFHNDKITANQFQVQMRNLIKTMKFSSQPIQMILKNQKPLK